MKIEQIDIKDCDLLELLKDDNVYYVRVNYRNDKNSTDAIPHPYGMSFSRLNNSKFRDLLPLLDSGEACIVRVT